MFFKKLFLLFIFFMLITVMMGCQIDNEKHAKKIEPKLSFQMEKQEGENKGYGYGIKSQRWKGDILEVVVFEELYNCDEKNAYYDITNNYDGDGKDLLIFYFREFGERTSYESDYYITFNLGPIEKKDYEIMIFPEYVDSSLFCYEEWNNVLIQMERDKSCDTNEDCFALSCGCYNNNGIFLKEEYELKGCQMPKYKCKIPTCVCLDNQCVSKDF